MAICLNVLYFEVEKQTKNLVLYLFKSENRETKKPILSGIMKNYVFLLLFGCCLTKYRFFIRLVVRQIKRQTDRQTFIYARLICGRDIYMFNKRKDFKGGWWIRWWHVGGGGFTSICEWKAAVAASRVKRRENESFCLDRMLKNNHTF